MDLGCGTGYTASYLRKFGNAKAVVGVEIDESLVADNKKNESDSGVTYEYYDGNILPFKSNIFDVVICCEVLEHINKDHQIQLVMEASRVLKEGGLAIFSTPNRPVYSPGGGSLNPDHIAELDGKQFEDLLKRSFSDIELWGQRYTNDQIFIRRQQSVQMASSRFGQTLKAFGVQHIVRFIRSFKAKKIFSEAVNDYDFVRGLSEDSFVQLGVCTN
tara:strand:+ start:1830 stop:2477 length:648 start_codon:yes stop_codon:yes gene_type:complete